MINAIQDLQIFDMVADSNQSSEKEKKKLSPCCKARMKKTNFGYVCQACKAVAKIK